MNHYRAFQLFPFVAFLVLPIAVIPGLFAQAPSGPAPPLSGIAIQQPPSQPKIGISVSLVNTPVTVRDSKNRVINTLDAQDFHVTDNGILQRILHFDIGGDPLSLVVLVETSSRVTATLPQISKAGIVITQTVMGSNGEGAVITFNDSVDKLQEFTSSPDKIEKVFAHLQPGTSGSKLYDAMTVAIEMFSGQAQPTADQPGRRRVMLIVSEATDIGSDTKFGDVLRRAELANVTIYTVGLSTTRAELRAGAQDTTPHPTPPGTFGTPPMPGTVQTPDTEAARLGSGNLMGAIIWALQHAKDSAKGNPLELAAAGTGGQYLSTFKDRTIEKAIDEIGGELHSQYSISYAPAGSNADGYHEIKVAISKKGSSKWTIRARPGYYIGRPQT